MAHSTWVRDLDTGEAGIANLTRPSLPSKWLLYGPSHSSVAAWGVTRPESLRTNPVGRESEALEGKTIAATIQDLKSVPETCRHLAKQSKTRPETL